MKNMTIALAIILSGLNITAGALEFGGDVGEITKEVKAYGADLKIPQPIKAAPSGVTLDWQALLNGVQVAVRVVYQGSPERIYVGAAEFRLDNYGIGGFGGSRKVTENNTVKADQNVIIQTDENAMAYLMQYAQKQAKEMGLKNWKEVKCSKGDDAFLVVTDNLTGVMVGNCMKPAGVKNLYSRS